MKKPPTGESLTIRMQHFNKTGPREVCGVINCQHMCHKDELFMHASKQMSCLHTHKELTMCGWANVRWRCFRCSKSREHPHAARTHKRTTAVAVTTPGIEPVSMSDAARARHRVSAAQRRSSGETSKGKEGRKPPHPPRVNRSQFHSALLTVCKETSSYQFLSAVF